ncbi:uncharacterized protein B0H64DRAFT_404175 [Chaetomium fimeti]|uniref:Uncharacterized protein n=1 Tax=Chaetomium fimeti TaxID=1854472 RepID=A0AAE0HB86_9PEZI|nr:hypothetical protein B0H64DRAFT_404175 [Chaetomium fimeti]
MASPLASGDESDSPAVRFFSASRPPSPSLVPGFLNLEVVNEKLRQRTLSPETPSAEKGSLDARKPFDELVELGGIPLRPWVDYRPEDLTDAQRGDDNGEEYMMCRYMDEKMYWQAQLRLWKRFAKRRSQDSESDLHSLEPIAAVTAFTTYLRGHLQRDMEDRVGPGREIWPDYIDMEWHREFIEDIVKNLPTAESLLKELRKENCDESTPEAPKVTREGLIEEYNIPHRQLWMKLWGHSQESLAEQERLLPAKRRRNDPDKDGSEGDARPSKRLASSAKPSAETASASPQESQKEQYPDSQQDAESKTLDSSGDLTTSIPKKLSQTNTKRGKLSPSKESTAVDDRTCRQPSDTGEGKTAPTTNTAKRKQELRGGDSALDVPGLRRSIRIAVRDPLSK